MSDREELPPQLREQLVRLQQLQQTLQAVVSQKQQLELEKAEIEKAISEIEKSSDDTPIYKNLGSILIRCDKQKLLSELKERSELTETRVTVLGKQEERTRTRLKETPRETWTNALTYLGIEHVKLLQIPRLNIKILRGYVGSNTSGSAAPIECASQKFLKVKRN
ncbi:MAG: prefoldin subunit beta [Candidatus Bathyarchaeia archaeon]